jgi:predicted dehydrogenase
MAVHESVECGRNRRDFIGGLHLEAIRRLGHIQIVALADPELDKAKQLGAEFSIGWVAADFQDILRDPAIDAVHVCTPHHLHFPVATAALEATNT